MSEELRCPKCGAVPVGIGYDGGMGDDNTSLKTMYEAARDNFLSFYRSARVVRAPLDTPAQFHEAYLRGYEQGHGDALQFEVVTGTVPPELDWAFESAWRCGYADAESIGIVHRRMLFDRVRQ